MRPLMKLLNIAVLMFVIVLQACGMQSAEQRTEVATPTAEPVAALPGPANNATAGSCAHHDPKDARRGGHSRNAGPQKCCWRGRPMA